MGNTQTTQTPATKNWQKIDTDNGIQIYKNIKTNQLAEKRIITLDPQLDIKKQIKVYKMRQNNNDALVRAFDTDDLSKKSSSFPACTGQNKIFVLTEKMPHKLSQLPQLTFPESLLFLRESLRAYEKLYKQYGPVEVTKQLIGLNYLGQVKCWLNSNWALNHRNHEYSNLRTKKLVQLTRQQYLAYRQQYLDEPEMAKTIISVIEQKCQEGRFPQAFKQEVISQSGSFKKLLLYLKDFVEYNQIYVPEKIKYDELVQIKYQSRLQQQLHLNLPQAQSQVGNAGNQSFNQGQQQKFSNFNNYQQSPNNFEQQGSLQKQGLNQQQQQLNQSNRYQLNSQLNQSYQASSQQPFIPQPLKQSPVSSDMAQITFSQSTRNYNQQQNIPINTTVSVNQQPSYSNYKWSNNVDTLYNPSFQKIQQTQQGSNLSGAKSDYTFGGLLNKAGNINYTGYQPAGYQFNTQNKNYQSSFGNSGINSNTNLINNSTFKYTSTSYGNAGSLDQNSSNFGNYGVPSNNYENFSSKYSSNTPTGTFAIGTLDSSKGYQNPTVLGYTNNSTYGTFDNNTTNQWGFSGPSNTTYKNQVYQYSSTKPILNDPSYASSAEKISTYSFDGKNDIGSKFTGGYTGNGYSNTLTKYQTETSVNPNSNSQFQGKYMDAFNTLLSPTIRGQAVQQNLSQAQASIQNSNISNGAQTIITTTQQKRQSSNVSGSHVTQKSTINEQQQSSNGIGTVLEGLAKMAQRTSNEVSESVLKEY